MSGHATQRSVPGRAFLGDDPQTIVQRLDHLMQDSHEGVAVVDDQSILRSWSPGAECIFGYSAEELLGQNETILLPPHLIEAGELAQIDANLRAGKAVRGHRTMRVSKDGTPLAVEISCRLLYRGDEIIGRSQIFRDLTESARVDRQMRQSQRLVTVAQLVTGLAHEIGTPLNVIAGRAELMLMNLPKDDPYCEEFRVIMQESERVAEMITTLLQYARGSNQVRLRRCSMNEVVNQVVRLMGPKMRVESIEVVSDLAPRLPLITGNRGQLVEVVLNLVFNAIQAMPEGGTLRLKTKPVEDAKGTWVQLQVSDTGKGIDPNHYGKIFVPFFSTKPVGQGTGLGLSMVSSIVQQHGGLIDFTSALGQGTTFTVTLPLERPKRTGLEQPA